MPKRMTISYTKDEQEFDDFFVENKLVLEPEILI